MDVDEIGFCTVGAVLRVQVRGGTAIPYRAHFARELIDLSYDLALGVEAAEQLAIKGQFGT
jgi:hypothetical protein